MKRGGKKESKRNARMVREYIQSARYLYGYCPCLECGEPVHLFEELGPYAGENKMRPTYEHIVSRGRGGTNGRENFAVTHWKCNNDRNRRDQLEACHATENA